jgi:hypothetical protein
MPMHQARIVGKIHAIHVLVTYLADGCSVLAAIKRGIARALCATRRRPRSTQIRIIRQVYKDRSYDKVTRDGDGGWTGVNVVTTLDGEVAELLT